jgi:hypothetical protein
MARDTQQYKRSLSGSIGAGMSSIFGASGKRYFILEYKISSKYHKAGEAQEIIVDQVEIGRDPKCQVRFDESFQTVSRRHAAIVKDGDNWKLVPLSDTNPTLLNGIKAQKEWFLQNGDEIQLSINGPKLGFIIPTGNKSTVGSIGLSRRLSLFRQQALRPYKQAITALFIILFLSIGGLTFWKFDSDKKWETKYVQAQTDADSTRVQNERALDELREKNEAMAGDLSTALTQITKIKKENATRIQQPTPPSSSSNASGGEFNNVAIDACVKYVYFIYATKIDVTLPDGSEKEVDGGWSGTGFLLNDGRFVTARHVAEAWYFVVSGGEVNQEMYILNLVANNGGKVVVHFEAYSSSGDKISFTSSQFSCNRSGDQSVVDDDGNTLKVANIDNTDWAYFRSGKTDGLNFDNSKSTSLERGTRLTVLGFPLGLGANSANDINPILGSGIAASNGLNQGVILTTDTNYEHGNSGGPVFYTDSSGSLRVIGIVSAGAGRSTGFVVPIASVN